jgi:hypothetical protein
MSQAKKDQVVDILANGLMNFVNATGDKEMMKLATIVLRDVLDVFVEHIKADDTCTFAFPTMAIPPDIPTGCATRLLLGAPRLLDHCRSPHARKAVVDRGFPASQ